MPHSPALKRGTLFNSTLLRCKEPNPGCSRSKGNPPLSALCLSFRSLGLSFRSEAEESAVALWFVIPQRTGGIRCCPLVCHSAAKGRNPLWPFGLSVRSEALESAVALWFVIPQRSGGIRCCPFVCHSAAQRRNPLSPFRFALPLRSQKTSLSRPLAYHSAAQRRNPLLPLPVLLHQPKTIGCPIRDSFIVTGGNVSHQNQAVFAFAVAFVVAFAVVAIVSRLPF